MKKGADVPNGKSMEQDEEKQILLRHDSDGYMSDTYDEPLPCFGYGIGWFCFILGIICPLLWYFATYLYLRNFSFKQPRERPGLAACAIAALICTVVVIIILLVLLL